MRWLEGNNVSSVDFTASVGDDMTGRHVCVGRQRAGHPAPFTALGGGVESFARATGVGQVREANYGPLAPWHQAVGSLLRGYPPRDAFPRAVTEQKLRFGRRRAGAVRGLGGSVVGSNSGRVGLACRKRDAHDAAVTCEPLTELALIFHLAVTFGLSRHGVKTRFIGEVGRR